MTLWMEYRCNLQVDGGTLYHLVPEPTCDCLLLPAAVALAALAQATRHLMPRPTSEREGIDEDNDQMPWLPLWNSPATTGTSDAWPLAPKCGTMFEVVELVTNESGARNPSSRKLNHLSRKTSHRVPPQRTGIRGLAIPFARDFDS